jgi:hypothetical protein
MVAVSQVVGHGPIGQTVRVTARWRAAANGVPDNTRRLRLVRDRPCNAMSTKFETFTTRPGPRENPVPVTVAVAHPQVRYRVDKGAPAGDEHRVVEGNTHKVSMHKGYDKVRSSGGNARTFEPPQGPAHWRPRTRQGKTSRIVVRHSIGRLVTACVVARSARLTSAPSHCLLAEVCG